MGTMRSRIHVGLRTIKTVAAVVISMIIVDLYGATSSKLILAMLGAMAAVQPSFKESLESCISQVIGVVFGAIVGVLLHLLDDGKGLLRQIISHRNSSDSVNLKFLLNLTILYIISIHNTSHSGPII